VTQHAYPFEIGADERSNGLRSELIGPLSVLVPLVGLMLLEAQEHGLPAAFLEDLAVLQRHLERLCRAAEVAIPTAGHNGDGPSS
jgi:hypothetical protein